MLFLKFIVYFTIQHCFKEAQAKPKTEFSFEIKSLCCDVSTDLVKRNYCHVQNLSKNKYVLNFFIELHRQLPLSTDIALMLDVRPINGQKSVKFINVKLKLCDALGNLKFNPILKSILQELFRRSNFPLSCPLKANILYNVSNMVIDDAIIPSYAPTLDYNFTMAFFEQKTELGKIVAKGSLKRERK
ncbi:uncharacterized protein [Musca autumnalis]|uniref:uncharacterized protein n=1 Tax=Musca autumnalis TaxID=221902 RepID=UPI003CE8BAE6